MQSEKDSVSSTREIVLQSALKLFNTAGYDGTSVRAIAEEAGANVALISYYFGGKQGLLEYLMSSFFEGYLSKMERVVRAALQSPAPAGDRLLKVADQLIAYQQDHFYLARFAHREMTLDTQLVRELMASYLMKEKYFLLQLIHSALPELAQDPLTAEFTTLQFRDFLLMPFLQTQFLREVFYLQPSEPAFREQYLRYIRKWVDKATEGKHPASLT